MKYCINCGKVIPDKAKCCSFCGVFQSDESDSGNIEVHQTENKVEEKKVVYVVKEEKPRVRNSVLGILSFIFSFTVILSPVSIILSIVDFIVMRKKRHALAIWGLIIGLYGTALMAIYLYFRFKQVQLL